MRLHKSVFIGMVIVFTIALDLSSISFACYTGPIYTEECCALLGPGSDMEDYCCKTEADCYNGIKQNCLLNYPYRLFFPCGCSINFALDNEEKIETLRRFRDEVLSETPAGRQYIMLYYQWSPVVVQMMEEDEELKEEVEVLLEELLPLIEEMLE